jgi:hypothetical protein
LAELVKNTNKEDISVMINHLISVVNEVLESMKYLFIINDNNNPVFTALVSLINFFKSYTVDIHGLNIIYLFDSKYYNLLKFVEDIHLIKTHIDIDGTLNQLYTDDACSISVELGDYKDRYKLKDVYDSYMSMLLHDRDDDSFMKDTLTDSSKHIIYKGSLDHQYNTDLLINHTNLHYKDKCKMRDELILTWES